MIGAPERVWPNSDNVNVSGYGRNEAARSSIFRGMMTRTGKSASQADRAKYFRRLHALRPLVLPNAWDAASARIIEGAGAAAIATTSAGISWSYGCNDGQGLPREDMLAAIGRIVRAVEVPVTADIESGYGSGTARDVADIARRLVEMGVAGVNLEDSPGRRGEILLAPGEHAERICAMRESARAAGGDLLINARVDVYLAEAGAPDTRFDAAVQRSNAYLAAGADCAFVPCVIDAETIAALVKAIDGPLNVMVTHGAPPVSQLGLLGVARVSVGPALTQAAHPATRRAARELLERGTYDALKTADEMDAP
jgi:2-methylisocitrate lyase-like PEP mutase family enzyme